MQILSRERREAASSCMARLCHAPGTKDEAGVISVTIPYIRSEIPLFVVFRALGFVADKDILEHLVYDFEDHEMMQLLPQLHRGGAGDPVAGCGARFHR